MRRSMATVCLSGLLEDKLSAIAAAGFDGVEIFEADFTAFDGSAADVRELCRSLGLTIEAYQPLQDFEGVDDATFRRNLARAERKFDLAEELGARCLVLCSNARPDADGDDARSAAQLRELAERAASRSLRIGYKALSWATHIRRAADALRLVERANHPHLGVVPDSFHSLALGEDLRTLQKIPAERIALVHIADAPRQSVDHTSWSSRYRCFPGQGDLDVSGFLSSVLSTGYAGPVSLDIWNDEWRGASPRRTASDGFRSFLHLEEGIAAARPASTNVELFDPPQAPDITGVSFIEFAADGEDARKLDAFLRSFGFVKAGMHRSKNVALYRNGAVNLVLNAEPNSFAQSYYLLHGPSICAIGLRTDDEQKALSRALDFRSQQFSGRIGPNELSIPATRAPDGSLIYFVGAQVESGGLYEIDFQLETPGPQGEASLTGVDHIAYALPGGELDSWVLYYRAVLGFDADATFRLADPNGVVKSRAVASKSRGVRIPLNISEGARTVTAQTVESRGGAGVHHVAFSTADIFATVDALKSNGAVILPIPPNYYDDLETRFALNPDLIRKMRLANILYDQAGEGVFLHCYSAPSGAGFYFEFVQRIGGYDQYGASNAPARLAALARVAREQQQPELM